MAPTLVGTEPACNMLSGAIRRISGHVIDTGVTCRGFSYQGICTLLGPASRFRSTVGLWPNPTRNPFTTRPGGSAKRRNLRPAWRSLIFGCTRADQSIRACIVAGGWVFGLDQQNRADGSAVLSALSFWPRAARRSIWPICNTYLQQCCIYDTW